MGGTARRMERGRMERCVSRRGWVGEGEGGRFVGEVTMLFEGEGRRRSELGAEGIEKDQGWRRR